MRIENDGITIWVASSDRSGVTVAVQPIDAANRVELYLQRRGRSAIERVAARWLWNDHFDETQYFRAGLAALSPADRYTAVCNCAGRQVEWHGESNKPYPSAAIRGPRLTGGTAGLLDREIYGRPLGKPDSNLVLDVAAPAPSVPSAAELDQLIRRFAPLIYFDSEEQYLMSSVEWFLDHATLYDGKTGQSIAHPTVSQLPIGPQQVGRYWLDAGKQPGNLDTAICYIHARANSYYTALDCWFFYPYNGPGTAYVKVEAFGALVGQGSPSVAPLGRHGGDWEHITILIDNSTKEMLSVYLAQHDGGKWIDDLSRFERYKEQLVIYSSRNGHASYLAPGDNLSMTKNWEKLGTGITLALQNECSRGENFNCAERYELIGADFLGVDKPVGPRWLDYPYRWGPSHPVTADTVRQAIGSALGEVAQGVSELIPDFIVDLFLVYFKKVEENGPTGPKQKDTWGTGLPTPPPNGVPMGVLTVDGNRPLVFIKDESNGHLWSYSLHGAQWDPLDLGLPKEGVSIVGALGAIAVDGYRPYVFVQGSDGHLWVYWTNKQGVGCWLDLKRPPAPTGAPDIQIVGSLGAMAVNGADGNRMYVSVQADDGALWISWSDGSDWLWSNQGVPPNGRQIVTSMGALTADDLQWVFFLDDWGYLRSKYYDGNNWYWETYGIPGLQSGDPLVPITGSMGAITIDRLPYVFAKGSDGNLWYYSNSVWTNLGTPGPTNGNQEVRIVGSLGAITVNTDELTIPRIFVKGEDGNLWVAHYDHPSAQPFWEWDVEGAPKSGVSVGEAVGATAGDSGDTWNVFIKGTDDTYWVLSSGATIQWSPISPIQLHQ